MRNPKTQKTFVLVHGSCQGAWCWDGVREHLRTRGHRVLAPALPGRGAVAVQPSLSRDDRQANA